MLPEARCRNLSTAKSATKRQQANLLRKPATFPKRIHASPPGFQDRPGNRVGLGFIPYTCVMTKDQIISTTLFTASNATTSNTVSRFQSLRMPGIRAGTSVTMAR